MKEISTILDVLDRTYPQADCSLDFSSPLELLVATVLSAQCTDKRVNLVTVELFRKYRSAADYVRVPQSELERDIQSTGFFRNKAKNIKGCCQVLVEQYDGEIPSVMDKLVELPGIRLQPKSEQSRFKISFYIDPRKAPNLEEIHSLLHQAELSVNVQLFCVP